MPPLFVKNVNGGRGRLVAETQEPILTSLDLTKLTCADLREISRHVDLLIIGAKSLPELCRKLNTLTTNGDEAWKPLRVPRWIGDQLVIVVWRPSKDWE